MISGGLLSRSIRHKEKLQRHNKTANKKQSEVLLNTSVSRNVYLNWPDKNKTDISNNYFSSERRKRIARKNNKIYAVQKNSRIDIISWHGFICLLGLSTIIAGIYFTKGLHKTFASVLIGVGIYFFAIAMTLMLEERNLKRKLVYLPDLYTKKRHSIKRVF